MTTTSPIQAQAASSASAPWYAAYPAPRSGDVASLTREEVLKLLETDGKVAGRDYLLVDVRRADHEGGSIRGSINLPAQSLYPTIPVFYGLVKAAGVRQVIWYCGSSRGRGTRAAGWFRDHVSDCGDDSVQSLILTGGITGWATAGDTYVQWMDEYEPTVWEGKGK